ncbi:hypothetical protein AAG594_05475 [Citromicrobium bathyomarinum]
MANERVKIKVGSVEVEFEGEGEFARSGALDILKEVIRLAPDASWPVFERDRRAGTLGVVDAATPNRDLTIATIAAHFDPKGTQDLIQCALAKLQIVDGANQATKDEIWECIKGATGYFKSSMNRNFPRDLGRMVKSKKVNEVASGTYSLTALTRKELEAMVADIG